ncbi:MAG: lysine 2,3-aminomutase [Hyphomicrobium sp. 32-62-53]|nr:MAG: lysine 2,3-aminomutase [Hyphomicrobium sp. 12-62-95]OYX99534.1 MAG: lysine 2,3-aminomutase [Hyphomicrobium sp. 32-62-53]
MTAREKTLRSASDLVAAGFAAPSNADTLAAVTERYAVAITPTMAALIDRNDPTGPIARQFVPTAAELTTHAAELADPIGDHAKSPVPGLVHRYPDRVLLKIVGVCPVYCRFCFRREMVGPDAGHNLTDAELNAALAYIQATPAIWEVILTGGDPFMLSARRVRALMQALDTIPHVKIVRWHTRVPVVAPNLVTDAFVAALTSGSKTIIVGIHANHPRELTSDARAALTRLATAGIPLVSQTVLLRGINDDIATLDALMRAFLETRIIPYYLHHGDLAPGTGHFRVPVAHGIALVSELHRRLSGIARPDYVLDLPGAFGKISLLSADVRLTADGCEIRDAAGRIHVYRDALP